MATVWIRALAAALLATLAIAVTCCQGEEPSNNKPNGKTVEDKDPVVLDIDGIQIRRSRIDALQPFIDKQNPKMGKRTRVAEAIEDVLRLELARRSFPSKRKALRAEADQLAKSLGNSASISQLENIGKRMRAASLHTKVYRHKLPFRVQAWAFDDQNTGLVSPVFEVPRGFMLVATKDKHHGPTPTYDKIDLYMMSFFVHEDGQDYQKWYSDERARIGTKVKYVHPDYRESLPRWVKP